MEKRAGGATILTGGVSFGLLPIVNACDPVEFGSEFTAEIGWRSLAQWRVGDGAGPLVPKHTMETSPPRVK
jgi:hypothetical protein